MASDIQTVRRKFAEYNTQRGFKTSPSDIVIVNKRARPKNLKTTYTEKTPEGLKETTFDLTTQTKTTKITPNELLTGKSVYNQATAKDRFFDTFKQSQVLKSQISSQPIKTGGSYNPYANESITEKQPTYYTPKPQKQFLGQETTTNKNMLFDAGFGTYTSSKQMPKEKFQEFILPKNIIYSSEKKQRTGQSTAFTSIGLGFYYGAKQFSKRGYEASFLGVGEEKGLKLPFKETIKEPFESFGTIITEPKESFKGLFTELTLRPEKVIGETTADVLYFKGLGKTSSIIKSESLKIGKKEIPLEKISTKGVISGKQLFPLSKSPTETLLRAEKQKALVSVTRSSFDKEVEIIGGSRGLKNLEDVGLFTSTKGRASLYFSGLFEQKSIPKFQFLPYENIAKNLEIPKILEIKGFKGFRRYPENLILQKGFKESNIYLTRQSGKQLAFVTKRSEIGTRGLKGLGQGTIEEELIIGKGSFIKRQSGAKYYTTYKGETLPIFEFELIGKKGINKIYNTQKSIQQYEKEYSGYFSSKSNIPTYRIFKSSISNKDLKNYYSDLKSIKSELNLINKSQYKYQSSTKSQIRNITSKPLIYSSKIRENRYKNYFKIPKRDLNIRYLKEDINYNYLTSNRNYNYNIPKREYKLNIPTYRNKIIITPIKTTAYIPINIKIPKKQTNINTFSLKSYKLPKIKEQTARLVIPDLYSVNITELKTGKEAVSPILTKGVRKRARSFFKGESFGYIPTEYLRQKARL